MEIGVIRIEVSISPLISESLVDYQTSYYRVTTSLKYIESNEGVFK